MGRNQRSPTIQPPFAPIHRSAPALVAAGLLAAVAACSRNVGPPPEEELPPAAYVVELAPAPGAATPPANAVLFLGARPAAGGPPALVARHTPAALPGRYVLTEENAMLPGGLPESPMHVFARLDADGDAGTSGPADWLGATTRPVPPDGRTLRIPVGPVAPSSDFRIPVAIAGPAPPASGVMYVLLRNLSGRVPVAAAKYPVPDSFPVAVTLGPEHLIGDAPGDLQEFEVIVKVDQDENPMTSVDGDLEGRGPAAADPVRIDLGPPPERTLAAPGNGR